jgi:broad specificity phosphatase PhoE
MTRDHANLQHRPFLTPIWLTVLGALLAFSFLVFAAWVWGTADSTTIVVVRHAEKELNAGADPPLTPAGEARAALLARMFGDSRAAGHIDAIYVSPALRNRMTAAPLAARLGVAPVVGPLGDARSIARRVLHEHAGGNVLVIAHSDSVVEIVEALSGTNHLPPIGDEEYGTMYIVSVPRIGRPNLLRLSY